MKHKKTRQPKLDDAKTSNQPVEESYSSLASSAIDVKLGKCIECEREEPIDNACHHCDESRIILVKKLENNKASSEMTRTTDKERKREAHQTKHPPIRRN